MADFQLLTASLELAIGHQSQETTLHILEQLALAHQHQHNALSGGDAATTCTWIRSLLQILTHWREYPQLQQLAADALLFHLSYPAHQRVVLAAYNPLQELFQILVDNSNSSVIAQQTAVSALCCLCMHETRSSADLYFLSQMNEQYEKKAEVVQSTCTLFNSLPTSIGSTSFPSTSSPSTSSPPTSSIPTLPTSSLPNSSLPSLLNTLLNCVRRNSISIQLHTLKELTMFANTPAILKTHQNELTDFARDMLALDLATAAEPVTTLLIQLANAIHPDLDVFASRGLIPYLVAMLQENEAVPTAQLYCCVLIMQLAVIPSNRVLIVQDHPIVIRYLLRLANSSSMLMVREHAVGAIRNLVHVENCVLMLEERELAPSLVELLTTGSADAKNHAASALCNIAVVQHPLVHNLFALNPSIVRALFASFPTLLAARLAVWTLFCFQLDAVNALRAEAVTVCAAFLANTHTSPLLSSRRPQPPSSTSSQQGDLPSAGLAFLLSGGHPESTLCLPRLAECLDMLLLEVYDDRGFSGCLHPYGFTLALLMHSDEHRRFFLSTHVISHLAGKVRHPDVPGQREYALRILIELASLSEGRSMISRAFGTYLRENRTSLEVDILLSRLNDNRVFINHSLAFAL